jgi:hypothetical protein
MSRCLLGEAPIAKLCGLRPLSWRCPPLSLSPSVLIPSPSQIGNEMRIHRDTCTGIELVVTAHTKMGIRYKVGVCSLDIETLVYDNASLGAILLPIYRMKKGPLHDSTFAIGEMNLQIQKRPYSALLPPNPPPYHTLQQIE